MKSNWLFFVLKKFNTQTRGRVSFITNFFPILGIGFGVTVLIVVLAIMNGFQRGYIDTIIEVSSSHVRLEASLKDLEELRRTSTYKSYVIFNEEQALLQGRGSKQCTAMIRSVEEDILSLDSGFKERTKIVKGSFDIKGLGDDGNYKIILGDELAKKLSIRVGDMLRVLASSGSSETELFPEDSNLLVTGLFKTGYYEIDSNFAFVSLECGTSLFGDVQKYFANVKFDSDTDDLIYVANINEKKPNIKATSWRDYNRAFFGALKIEKNVMMLLIILIFLVVGVNIYNGMRRSIYEKREDISVILSMGAKHRDIKGIFIINGFSIGILGSTFGTFLGLLISININAIFSFIEKCINFITYFASSIAGDNDKGNFAIFNKMYFYMEEVPTKIFFNELFFIFLFALASSTLAAWIATKKVIEICPAEILRYE